MARRITASDETTADAPLLEVTDLRTHFLTPRGRVRAVDGVSLTLERGRTLGLLGIEYRGTVSGLAGVGLNFGLEARSAVKKASSTASGR